MNELERNLLQGIQLQRQFVDSQAALDVAYAQREMSSLDRQSLLVASIKLDTGNSEITVEVTNDGEEENS